MRQFGEIAQSITERVDDPATAGVDRYVGLEHLDPESIHIKRWGSPSDVDSTKLRFYPGDVVYGRRRAYQRKLVRMQTSRESAQHTLWFSAPAPDTCLGDFLPYFLQSDAFFMNACLHIGWVSLTDYQLAHPQAIRRFAIPSIEEQNPIVEVLGAAEHLRSSYSRTAVAAADYWLALAHEHLVTEQNVPLETVANVDLGKKRDPKLLIDGVPTPYLRAANVKFGHFDLDDVLQMNFTDAEVARFVVEAGDVLVTEGCGSIGEVGACATWNGHTPEAVCFQMTLLRLHGCDRELARLLRSLVRLQLLIRHSPMCRPAPASTTLSAAWVRKMPFPVLGKQQRKLVIALLDSAETLEQAARTALDEASRLAVRLRESLLTGADSVH